MNFGIIGCGLMGKHRAQAVTAIAQAHLISVFDPSENRALTLAKDFHCSADETVQALLARPEIDAVVIAVPHYLSKQICIDALHAGKHIFCEKPLGLSSSECEEIIRECPPDRTAAVGFNYRFYPGVRQAMRMITDGSIGALTHLRCVLGHGGRPGMEFEWKTSKAQCGGGSLLDPGIHFLDLIRQAGGELAVNGAALTRSFWEVDVEDNAFLLLSAGETVEAQVHISLTEWKSRFSIDFFGTDGQLKLRGRSGFYGPQVLTYNRRWEWLQPEFTATRTEYPLEDVSFTDELRAFIATVEGRSSEPVGTADDCLQLLRLVEGVYSATSIATPKTALAATVR
ncbi:MAG TPA: Gfo/Idh/MocA family oxidoreductase [Bryobacteraceae bacterium]|nr:Gfo/Idh/MocA family oxidoreductase [Bryobacteraceae bacterium]